MEENLKILVVDDDQTNGSIVSLALTQTAISMEIDEVKDGNHAFFALINNLLQRSTKWVPFYRSRSIDF